MLCGHASLSQLADQSSLKSELGFFISDCGCALIHKYVALRYSVNCFLNLLVWERVVPVGRKEILVGQKTVTLQLRLLEML